MLDSASSKTGGESHIWFIQPSGLQVLPHHSACFSELSLLNLLLRIQECFLTFSPLSWSVLLLTFTFSPSVTVSHPHLPPPLSAPLSGQGGDSSEVDKVLTSSRISSERVMAKRTGEEEEEGDEMSSESQSDSVLQLSLTHMCSCFHHFRRRYTDFISRITTFNITVQNAHFYQKMLP